MVLPASVMLKELHYLTCDLPSADGEGGTPLDELTELQNAYEREHDTLPASSTVRFFWRLLSCESTVFGTLVSEDTWGVLLAMQPHTEEAGVPAVPLALLLDVRRARGVGAARTRNSRARTHTRRFAQRWCSASCDRRSAALRRRQSRRTRWRLRARRLTSSCQSSRAWGEPGPRGASAYAP